jgi:hypothetical protein
VAWRCGALTVTTISRISVRSSSLRSRSVVVAADQSRGRSRATLASATRSWPGVLERDQLSALPLDLGERVLKLALQRAGNETVLRLARVELPLSPLSFVFGALECEALTGEQLLMLVLELADRARGRTHTSRGHRGTRRRQPPPSARRRATGGSCRCGAARARERRDNGARSRRSAHTRPASAGRTARSGPTPGAELRLRGRRRRLAATDHVRSQPLACREVLAARAVRG